MNRKIIFIMLIFAAILAACNLPTKSGNGPAAPALTMEDMVLTAQAERSLTQDPTPVPQDEEDDDSGLIITRFGRDPEPVEDQNEPAQEVQEEIKPTADPNRQPPALPEPFTTDLLNPLDTPHTYEEDTCRMIKNRWGKDKAAPGTIVMAIMYHAIVKGDTVDQDNAITSEQHKKLMNDLHDQGFTAISTEQFIGFMENNDKIPERSVLLIVDDRHSEQNYIDHFKWYYDNWGWPVINAWISAEGTTKDLWDGNAHAEAEGYVDHQSHGVVHNIPMGDDSSDEYLIGELKGSVDQIQEHFGKTPRAIIWPGGGFGARAIEVAKEYGYKVGFTTHPRGPVMYNWVPLCDTNDMQRPYYKLDGNMDPLFVIPRYWDTDAAQHVDTVRQIGKAAKDYLYSIRETEVEYYDIVCKPVMGDL